MNRLRNLSIFKKLDLLKPPSNIFNLIESDNLEENIRRQLKLRSIAMKFNFQLEKAYQMEDMPARIKRYFIFGLISILFYNLICITDYLTLPHLIEKILILRLAITLPVMLAITSLLFFPVIYKYVDFLAIIMVAVITSQTVIILKLSNFSDQSFYNLAWLSIIPVVLNVIIRIKFYHAFLYSLAALSVYIYLILYLFHWPGVIIFNNILFTFIITGVSILSNYQVTKEQRREFLYKMLLRINSLSLEDSNRELIQLSSMDSLTGLRNRGFFDMSIRQEWASAMKEGKPIALIFIDIDNFKKYNDNYGHQAGDKCIIDIADTISRYSRRFHDLCARYGGEEFVILLPHFTAADAAEHAERIKEGINNLNIRHEYSDTAPNVTISLGVAGIVPKVGSSYTSLVEAADKALYQAKAEGKNRVVVM